MGAVESLHLPRMEEIEQCGMGTLQKDVMVDAERTSRVLQPPVSTTRERDNKYRFQKNETTN